MRRVPAAIRSLVRERAGFQCEYCGVTEEDSAAELTIDHHQPRSRGGDDSPDNLVYCCHTCNGHKASYWPRSAGEPLLWNPRAASSAKHFLLLADGNVIATSPVGQFTIDRLCLNRSHLIAHRLARLRISEPEQAAAERREALAILRVMKEDLADNMRENREVLREMRVWLERNTID